jgi:hypothetical protein
MHGGRELNHPQASSLQSTLKCLAQFLRNRLAITHLGDCVRVAARDSWLRPSLLVEAAHGLFAGWVGTTVD